MFSETNDFYRVLSEQGEIIGGSIAALILLAAYAYELWRRHKERQDKKTTARYWIFYNASNRVRQDFSVIRQLDETLHSEPFREIINAATRSDGVSWSNLGHISGSDKCRQIVHNTLYGFQQTWKNDDALMEKIIFEFSLLDDHEQIRTLKYYGRYSALQDRVSLLIPYKEDERLKDVVDPKHFITQTFEIYARMVEGIFLGYRLLSLVLHKNMAKGLSSRMNELRDIMDEVAKNCMHPEKAGIELSALPIDPRAFDWVVRYHLEDSPKWLDGDLKNKKKPFEWDGYTNEAEREEAHRNLAQRTVT